MACAVALSVLRDPGLAQDAAQEAYLRAFRRLGDLEDPAGFVTWFRRVVITVALNLRRSRRTTLLQVDEVPDVPVLDEAESSWTDAQRQRLSAALLTLTPAERRLCDRRYHGGWSLGRLAQDAGVPEPVMRKRLQRVRDKLRKEIDVSEQRGLTPDAMRPDLPAVVVELLARPQLTDLPEHPVGDVLAAIRARVRGPRADRARRDRRPDPRPRRHRVRCDLRRGERAASHRRSPHPALRPDAAAAARRALHRHAAAAARRRQGLSPRARRRHPPRGVPPGGGVLARHARQPRSLARHGPGAAVDRGRAARPQRADHAEPLHDVQPGLGAGRRLRRAVVRGDGVGRLHRSRRRSTSAAIRPCTRPSASATGSSAWRCCATASTTSARSKPRGWRDRIAGLSPARR